MCEAFTTSRKCAGASRYTSRSSIKVPCGVSRPEYCACPTASRDASLQQTPCTAASASRPAISICPMWLTSNNPRSEEHTSELQSLRHLVCRLLLEKKKIEEM